MNKYFTYYLLPILIWATTIFYLSSNSNIDTSAYSIPFLDKIAHFSEYCILGFLITRALFRISTHTTMLLLSILICMLYGISDEIHQLFVPNRQFDIYDIVWDTIGASFAQIIWIKKSERRIYAKKNQNV